MPSEDRLWRSLLGAGALTGALFLGLQTYDYFSDASRPILQKSDFTSALGSIALLAIVGVVAARRAHLKRQASPPPPKTKRMKTTKRVVRSTRRKRRA